MSDNSQWDNFGPSCELKVFYKPFFAPIPELPFGGDAKFKQHMGLVPALNSSQGVSTPDRFFRLLGRAESKWTQKQVSCSS